MTSISPPPSSPPGERDAPSDELANRRPTIPVRPHALQEEEDLAASGHADAFSGARACFARGDLERAERLSRRANREQPADAEALALLAWIESLNPSNTATEAIRKRIAMLSRAIDLDDHCENAIFWRAQLHKRTENHPAAIRDFKRVLALNEEHVDAVRELRIYEMRVRHKSITIRTSTPSGGMKRASPSGFMAKRPA
jgi:tetratricopeptide (TPR) repeat protein